MKKFDREIVEWADYISRDNAVQPDLAHSQVEQILALLMGGLLTIEEAAAVLTRLMNKQVERDMEEYQDG